MRRLLVAAALTLPFLPMLRSTLQGTLPTVNYYTAADGGGDDAQDCSRRHPCATIEKMCSKVPKDLDRPYVLHVGAGTYSAGCHLVGLRQVSGEDWSSPGSVTVDCAMATSNTALLGWVTAGSSATRDVWGLDGGSAPSSDDWKGKFVQVVSGTGADDELWPIVTNASDRLTIEGVSTAIGPTTAPVAGSGVTIWTPDVTFTGNLSDAVTAVGFPPVAAPTASVFILANNKGFGSDSAAPFITIRGCKFGSGSGRGVNLQGPLSFVQNTCSANSSSCIRGLDGIVTGDAERNVVNTGASSFIVVGNAANGSFVPVLQAYNNFFTGAAANFIAGGQIGQLFSGMNEVNSGSNEAIRVNAVADGVSKYDKITTSSSCLRSPLVVTATDIGAGARMDFVGLTCTGTGTYDFNLSGASYVTLDSASTDTASNHHAAVNRGAKLYWVSGATLNGAGSDDFAYTATGASVTEAGATSGATAKYVCDDQGTCVGIAAHAGGLYSPVVAPVGTTSGADGQIQACSGTATATTGVASVTFASAARCAAFSATPSWCGCNERGDAGTNVPCSYTALSSTAVTFVGDTGRGTSTLGWSCFGPK